MQHFLKPLIILLVIGFFYVLLKLLEHSKRKKEDSITDISQLKQRKIRHFFQLPDDETTSIPKLIELLKDKDLRVPLQTDNEAVLHLKNANQSKFDGVLNTHALDMPVRIILQKEKDQVNVTIEEDYGFQMFVGPAKHDFKKKYEDVFAYYEELISSV